MTPLSIHMSMHRRWPKKPFGELDEVITLSQHFDGCRGLHEWYANVYSNSTDRDSALIKKPECFPTAPERVWQQLCQIVDEVNAAKRSQAPVMQLLPGNELETSSLAQARGDLGLGFWARFKNPIAHVRLTAYSTNDPPPGCPISYAFEPVNRLRYYWRFRSNGGERVEDYLSTRIICDAQCDLPIPKCSSIEPFEVLLNTTGDEQPASYLVVSATYDDPWYNEPIRVSTAISLAGRVPELDAPPFGDLFAEPNIAKCVAVFPQMAILRLAGEHDQETRKTVVEVSDNRTHWNIDSQTVRCYLCNSIKESSSHFGHDLAYSTRLQSLVPADLALARHCLHSIRRLTSCINDDTCATDPDTVIHAWRGSGDPFLQAHATESEVMRAFQLLEAQGIIEQCDPEVNIFTHYRLKIRGYWHTPL